MKKRNDLCNRLNRDLLRPTVPGKPAEWNDWHPLFCQRREIAENLIHVTAAIAIGFLFAILFHRSESLLPCIITHSAINVTNGFANEAGLTIEKCLVFQLMVFVITVSYSFILTKTLPKS